MAVTRLKRKDRKNKTVSRLWNQLISMGRDKSVGSKAETNPIQDRVMANKAVLDQLKSAK
jgi:hypothetical protein